eukprot:5789154-Karenia_brevis.AAC.1
MTGFKYLHILASKGSKANSLHLAVGPCFQSFQSTHLRITRARPRSKVYSLAQLACNLRVMTENTHSSAWRDSPHKDARFIKVTIGSLNGARKCFIIPSREKLWFLKYAICAKFGKSFDLIVTLAVDGVLFNRPYDAPFLNATQDSTVNV